MWINVKLSLNIFIIFFMKIYLFNLFADER